jgi:EAL domain-containing protein (putative c-di-GMP-specific phosphodiesterase class I)
MGKRDLRLHINVHIGACRLEDSGTSPEEVIKCAETALWAARDEGPNAASELTAEAVARRQRRAELQQLLPEALVRGEFDIHYQPQVLMASGQVAGYEALLRWTSPVLGPVTPDEFIPVAEETGIIVPLGYWVLDQGIVFARKLRDAGTPAVVSVNVSPVQFLHHDFLDEVTRRIGASGVEPRYLGLEITESTLMEGIDQLGPSLRKIMASGVKVSLDDFGTGYSSLNYLKDLPLHVLKIDKSFIDALEGDDRAYHLIECIIDLAHHLGLVVIAEGIETGRQRELLAEVDCDLVQGYLTGRPRPARDHLDQVPV